MMKRSHSRIDATSTLHRRYIDSLNADPKLANEPRKKALYYQEWCRRRKERPRLEAVSSDTPSSRPNSESATNISHPSTPSPYHYFKSSGSIVSAPENCAISSPAKEAVLSEGPSLKPNSESATSISHPSTPQIDRNFQSSDSNMPHPDLATPQLPSLLPSQSENPANLEQLSKAQKRKIRYKPTIQSEEIHPNTTVYTEKIMSDQRAI